MDMKEKEEGARARAEGAVRELVRVRGGDPAAPVVVEVRPWGDGFAAGVRDVAGVPCDTANARPQVTAIDALEVLAAWARHRAEFEARERQTVELRVEFTLRAGYSGRRAFAAWRCTGGPWSATVPDVVADRIVDEVYAGHVEHRPRGEVCTASISLTADEWAALGQGRAS